MASSCKESHTVAPLAPALAIQRTPNRDATPQSKIHWCEIGSSLKDRGLQNKQFFGGAISTDYFITVWNWWKRQFEFEKYFNLNDFSYASAGQEAPGKANQRLEVQVEIQPLDGIGGTCEPSGAQTWRQSLKDVCGLFGPALLVPYWTLSWWYCSSTCTLSGQTANSHQKNQSFWMFESKSIRQVNHHLIYISAVVSWSPQPTGNAHTLHFVWSTFCVRPKNTM